MGKEIDYILEVIEFEKDRLMVMETVKGPFPMKVTYQFDAISLNKTFAQVRVQGSSKGFYKLADFLMAPMVKKNIAKDIKRLKNILEN
jgi:hypothetical protein